ncbi:hypothetical protein K8I31_00070, partial [bacterium]|nr:hypothetical protein [bacterium]
MKTPILFVTLIVTTFYSHSMFASEVSPASLETILSTNNGDVFYIADTTLNCIYQIDASNNQIIASLALPGSPTGMALADDTNRLYITCDGANPCLAVANLRCMKIESQIPLQAGACAPILIPQRNKVLVCERFAGQAALIDLDALEVQQRISVGREPIAADITPDGKWILIANHLPEGASNQYKRPGGIRATTLRGATVQMINLNCASERNTIELMLGSNGLKDIAIAPNGNYAVVPHVLAYYRRPTKQVKRGRINRNALSIIDLDKRELHNTVLLDDYNHGAANPWQVAFSDDGKLLAVTHAGSHEVSLIQFDDLLNKIHSMPMYGYSNYGGKAYAQASIP